jgi:hypothetical protein
MVSRGLAEYATGQAASRQMRWPSHDRAARHRTPATERKYDAVTESDIARVQAYLRATLGTDRIHIDVPKRKGASVEVRVGTDFLGTLHRDEEDNEVSFSLHVTILEEDLPALAKPRAR